MQTKEYLLNRVDVFSDTDEVIEGLQYMADRLLEDGNTYPYEELEAIANLQGLHKLVKEFAEYVGGASQTDSTTPENRER